MILVTGGTGFVGAHLLLHLLENKESVRAIFRSESQKKKTLSLFQLYKKESLFSKIEWVQADILDIPALEIAFQDISEVYHCAALISFDPNDENQLRKVNIEGTANMVNLSLDFGIQKFCHMSSIAALGNPNQNENYITETTEWNPEILHSDYAISKHGAEMEVWRGQQEGLNVIVVNPGIILGKYPLDWDKNQGSNSLFTQIKKGIPFYTNGNCGYISVSDVVNIMYQLMQSAIKNQQFTLVAENYTYKDIIFTVAQRLKVKKPTLEAKPWMLSLVWRLDWLRWFFFRSKRKLSRHAAISLSNTDRFSNEKIKLALMYHFEDIIEVIDKIVHHQQTTKQ